jgi:hypothetical protein
VFQAEELERVDELAACKTLGNRLCSSLSSRSDTPSGI